MTRFSSLACGLIAGLCLAISAIPVSAQLARMSQPGRGFGAGYDAAHEVTLTGTVREVVTRRTLGSPLGVHLLVAGAEGVVDAHVGPFLSKESLEALHVGVLVQIVGAMQNIHGTQYLLARQLIFAGRLVTVRSSRGFLLQTDPHRSPSHTRRVKSEENGGAR